LAFLPLTDGYSSIVWSTSPSHAQALLAMTDEQFGKALADAYEGRLGDIVEIGKRAAFPLRFLVAEHYIQPGMALIGDAAHTIHPLAGQGVNLGIMDAASLAEVITNAQRQHQAIGSEAVLRRYERWRKAENASMYVMVDQIQRLFGMQQPGMQWMRMLGMSTVQQLAPLKNLIIQHAMGNRGDLPALAR
jgi:2-octaprenylphenol hydroxylase